MKPSQRIVLNTAATYTRSIIAAGLTLFSSRWVLNALGHNDFGIYSVVGSIIIFIIILNSVLAASAGRYYAFAIGQGEPEEVNSWFNAALSIHLLIAVVLTLIGWPIGEYIIENILNIPASRSSAAISVFRVSLMSAFIGMLSIPFIAMFTAKQHIAELAVWGLLQSILIFLLAWFLIYATGDKLIFFAVGMVVIMLIIQISQMIRALSVFDECKIDSSKWFDKKRIGAIFSFAGWSLVGSLGVTMRDHGSAILLNFFGGTQANAAYAVANQTSGQTNQLAAAMQGSFMPEITASEGRGDRRRMLDLSLRSCKFATVLVIIFAAPLIIEMDYVLKLWLVNPPMHTGLLCQFILLTLIIDRLSSGYAIAVNAYGKIASYQVTLGMISVLTLPLAWLFLKLGFAPPSIGIAFIIIMSIITFGRVLWVRHLFNVSIQKWIVSVLMPCIFVSSAALLGALMPRLFLQVSFNRLVLVVIVSIAGSILATWFIAFDVSERRFVRKNIGNFANKLFN